MVQSEIRNPKSEIPPVPALVLAGGKTGAEFAAAAGVPEESGARFLAQIGGQAMVRYVLRALQGAALVSRVVLVAPPGFPEQPEADLLVPADGGLEENIRTGLQACGEVPFFLIVTADIPFITPEGIDDYIRRSAAADVDCCYAAIPREACEKQFPGTKRTYVRLSGAEYTGGNVVFQRASAYERQADLLREAYQRRKNPLFMVRLIGAGNVLKFLAGKLRLEDVEAAAGRLMGVRCRLMVTPHAELGTDVDKPGDLALARQLLAK